MMSVSQSGCRVELAAFVQVQRAMGFMGARQIRPAVLVEVHHVDVIQIAGLVGFPHGLARQPAVVIAVKHPALRIGCCRDEIQIAVAVEIDEPRHTVTSGNRRAAAPDRLFGKQTRSVRRAGQHYDAKQVSKPIHDNPPSHHFPRGFCSAAASTTMPRLTIGLTWARGPDLFRDDIFLYFQILTDTT